MDMPSERNREPVDLVPLAASPAPVASTIEKTAEAIAQGIRNGSFLPGQYLLEPDLAKRFGVSRGSLREALKYLAAQGIVVLNRHKSASISILDRKSVLDLADTIEPLLRVAAGLAAQNCRTDAQRQRMRGAAEDIAAAVAQGNLARYYEKRRNFYDVIVDLGGNRELARAIPLARADLFRAPFDDLQTDSQRREHFSNFAIIAEAIADSRAHDADVAIRRHFEGARRILMGMPESTFARAAGQIMIG